MLGTARQDTGNEIRTPENLPPSWSQSDVLCLSQEGTSANSVRITREYPCVQGCLYNLS